jgi:hypothetical protein
MNFDAWTIPIYYEDGKIGQADEYTAVRIAIGEFIFGPKLSNQDQRKYEGYSMARRGPKPKVTSQAIELIEALKFISVASTRSEADYMQHCFFVNGCVCMTDGNLTAGYPVAEQLSYCPNFDKLQTAVAKSGKSLTIAELESNRLSVKGEKFRAIVPCLAADKLPPFDIVQPHPQVAPVDDRLKAALDCCGSYTKENGVEMLDAAIKLESMLCVGLHRKQSIVQYYHGIDLPPHIILPKIYTDAVAKAKIPLVGFGFEWNEEKTRPKAITLWFENGAWLRTLCYGDTYPDIEHLFNDPSFPKEIPPALWEAVDMVKKFGDNETVILMDGRVQSHASDEIGAQYIVEGLEGNKQFDSKLLKLAEPYMKTCDFTSSPNRIYWFGENVRGIIMSYITKEVEAIQDEEQ